MRNSLKAQTASSPKLTASSVHAGLKFSDPGGSGSESRTRSGPGSGSKFFRPSKFDGFQTCFLS